jgi:acid phosphatase type 7
MLDHSNDMNIVIGQNPIQFNYTSEYGAYQSNFIYHIEIPNLKAGLQFYWYHIFLVFPNHENDTTTNADDNDVIPFSPTNRISQCHFQIVWDDENLERNDGRTHATTIDQCIQTLVQRNILSLIHDFPSANANHWNHQKNEPSIVDDNRQQTSKSFHQQQRNIRSLQSKSNYTKFTFSIFNGMKESYTFVTPPLPQQPTTIAFVGDLGQTKNSMKTMAHIRQHSYATTDTTRSTIINHSQPLISNVVIVGDVSYADSDPYRWTRWFQFMEPFNRHIPISVVPGNHEIECNIETNDIFVLYENFFYNPNRIHASDMKPISNQYKDTLWNHSCSAPSQFEGIYNYGNSFYSYIHGLVYIIGLNSYTSTNQSSLQYQWLLDQFQNHINRTITPWVIVTFHAPIYTTFRGHNNESEAQHMQQSMEELFDSYHVNLVFSGHDHAYMRTKSLVHNPVHPKQPILDPKGHAPIYIILGTGGNREGHARGYLHPHNLEYFVETRNIDEYGYSRIQFYNGTHAYYEWKNDDSKSTFHDSLWLYNPFHHDGNSRTN